MRRFFLFLVFFLVCLTVTRQIHAADAYNERWTCLDATLSTLDKTIPPIAANAGAPYQKYTHSATLKTKGTGNNPLPNADTYIVECVQIATTLVIPEAVKKELNYQIPKEVCTTGNSETDMFIWNNDRLKLVQKLFSGWDHYKGWDYLGYTPDGYYKFDYATKLQPENTTHIFKTDEKGDFKTGPFAYVNYILGAAERKFMAYNRFAKDPSNSVGGVGGQQQGILEFDFVTANKDCVKISWDPYGKVFDSQTLEPVPGAQIALQINKSGTYVPVTNDDVPSKFIENPFTVKEDGYFSFIVPDGTYKLTVNVPGYTFPNTSAPIDPNYQHIYSDLYHGEDIVQKGKMVHKDIPVDPIATTTKQKYAAKLMGVFQTVMDNGSTIVDGQVSHPFAKINAYCKTTTGTRGKLNRSVQADKNGDFKLTFDPNLCNQNQGEMYAILETESIDLTGSLTVQSVFSRFFSWITRQKEVKAASYVNTYTFDPILNQMEGYAFDERGEAIPNATVATYAIGDTNPYRTVSANNEGRFSLATDQFPNAPYVLKYSNKGKLITTSTSRFISQNISVIKQDHIDLYTRSKETPSLLTANNSSSPKISPANSKTNSVSDISGNSSIKSMPLASKSTPTTNSALKNQIITLIILMLVIGIVGIFIALYILKKK